MYLGRSEMTYIHVPPYGYASYQSPGSCNVVASTGIIYYGLKNHFKRETFKGDYFGARAHNP